MTGNSGHHADTIRRYIEASPPERARNERTAVANNLTIPAVEASDALNALVAQLVAQADRIAWLEGEVAGWRIKLAECEAERIAVGSGRGIRTR